jgi:hypothetical protein
MRSATVQSRQSAARNIGLSGVFSDIGRYQAFTCGSRRRRDCGFWLSAKNGARSGKEVAVDGRREDRAPTASRAAAKADSGNDRDRQAPQRSPTATTPTRVSNWHTTPPRRPPLRPRQRFRDPPAPDRLVARLRADATRRQPLHETIKASS